jgi:hypothetical protein
MVMVPTNPKPLCRKAAFLGMLFFACAFLVQSAWAAEGSEPEAAAVLNAYHGTQNTVLKRKALRMLSENVRATGVAVAQWKKDLLREALDEQDPTVVEAAVYQIKMLQMTDFNRKLIDLYRNAKDLYANVYDRRVQIAIVRALSITGKGDANVFALFQEVLEPVTSKFAYVQGDVLISIKELNDPKYTAMVEKYGAFMESAIAEKKAAGEHPMLYQILVDYASMCKDIVTTLKRQ